jgi:DNA (cytosine-5)-methyltransferase 1
MRLLDLFAGAGGCSVGYARAGFEVVGVDIEPHPDYPFDLTVADAMEVLADADYLRTFDVVHASPPCPRYSVATKAHGTSDNHPDLVGPSRDLLNAAGVSWVMENVPGAPMPNAVMVCGQAMGLPFIRRHRLFESSEPLMSPGCACNGRGTVSIFGHSGEDRRGPEIIGHVSLSEARSLMGVEWMTRRSDVSDAIPPAYTEFIGGQLMDALVAA